MAFHPFDRLSLAPTAGTLILTPCPGKKDVDALTALAQLRAAGAQAVLTLMPADELARIGVANIGDLCAQVGVPWFHCPIEDDQAPEAEFEHAWRQHRQAIHRLLDEGKPVAIHCRGGSGRTGLLAAQILIERGRMLPEVVSAVQLIRPQALGLRVHREYLARLAEDEKSAAASR